jgi:hypothetical protein
MTFPKQEPELMHGQGSSWVKECHPELKPEPKKRGRKPKQ